MADKNGWGSVQRKFDQVHRTVRAQGATEYLVLLAVVLIIALVSVALLGFFPGMASDSQITQSKIYWQSASPISILESGAIYGDSDYSHIYIRLKNTGTYPIRITKIIGPANASISKVIDSDYYPWLPGYQQLISDHFYLGPGEEKYFGDFRFALSPYRAFYASVNPIPEYSNYTLSGASSICTATNNLGVYTYDKSVLDYKSFGFEYVAYVEGQQITKKQIGKDLLIKCQPPL